MTHYDMSGSEDGQLRSPGDEHMISGDDDVEHDTDSLDIKPPQAAAAVSSTGARRKEKSVKDKKHSKERKHKERNNSGGREREPSSRGSISGSERRSDVESRRDPRREEVERYHQRSYEREENREMLLNNERRYQKQHYDRGGGVGPNHNYHHHHQQQQQQHYQQHHPQMHMQRHRQQDYYERGPHGYHHGGGGGVGEYHNNRHQPYVGGKHGGHGGGPHMEYAHHDDVSYEMQQRERRKYASYESSQKDAESLEQDLRSRLLSKRHKYVKSGNELEEQYELHSSERTERSFEERERAALKLERHKKRHARDKDVIEVLDSPENATLHVQEEALPPPSRHKHKRHQKDKAIDSSSAEKQQRNTLDDPELQARKSKLLAAEREKEKRQESARSELEARRERRRERKAAAINLLSPGAVAASVTAGLNVVVKRKKSHNAERVKRKRAKKSTKAQSDEDDDDEMEEGEDDNDENHNEDDESDSEAADELHDDDDSEDESSSDSAAESEQSYKKTKTKSKKHKRSKAPTAENSNDEVEIALPESPLSIGELSKSPKRHKSKKHRKHTKPAAATTAAVNNVVDNDDDDDEEVARMAAARSRSRTRSASRSARSRSPTSRSRSATHSRSSRSRSLSATSRSRSRSDGRRSSSRSARSQSRSPHSRSESRDRSEERDMHAHKRKAEAELKEAAANPKKKNTRDSVAGIDSVSPVRDDKGVPLPNYLPGVQGCRSVEEFQCLNRIEEGTYGVVYRAKDKRTNEIVALKRLKMEKEKEGFPITSLREINTLLKGQHPNIVTVREIVVGSNMDKIFIVMDYVEHDLKSLMETMKTRKQYFLPGEVKCLTQQLLRAVGHLHDNWILHRDLKTSNLLLSHKGILKVGDFGLAREYGSPLKKYTSLVVTLWYRAPELLLCSPEYSTPIDIWSVGCIYGEFLQMAPLFPGKTEIDELNRIFKELGTPNEKIWPGYKDLPAVKNILSQNSQFTEYPVSNLRKRYNEKTTETGISLLQALLTFDPKQRLTADAALKHAYFKELPLPIDPSMFPTWPAKSELGARKALASSPKPPSGGSQFKQLGRDDIIVGDTAGAATGSKIPVSGIITGNKKTTANTGFVLNAGMDQRQLAMGPGFNLKF